MFKSPFALWIAMMGILLGLSACNLNTNVASVPNQTRTVSTPIPIVLTSPDQPTFAPPTSPPATVNSDLNLQIVSVNEKAPPQALQALSTEGFGGGGGTCVGVFFENSDFELWGDLSPVGPVQSGSSATLNLQAGIYQHYNIFALCVGSANVDGIAIGPTGEAFEPIFDFEYDGQMASLHLPLEAYLIGGRWTILLSEPQSFEVVININLPNEPYLVSGLPAILSSNPSVMGRYALGGFNPGEQVVGVFFDQFYLTSSEKSVREFRFQVNASGQALIEAEAFNDTTPDFIGESGKALVQNAQLSYQSASRHGYYELEAAEFVLLLHQTYWGGRNRALLPQYTDASKTAPPSALQSITLSPNIPNTQLNTCVSAFPTYEEATKVWLPSVLNIAPHLLVKGERITVHIPPVSSFHDLFSLCSLGVRPFMQFYDSQGQQHGDIFVNYPSTELSSRHLPLLAYLKGGLWSVKMLPANFNSDLEEVATIEVIKPDRPFYVMDVSQAIGAVEKSWPTVFAIGNFQPEERIVGLYFGFGRNGALSSLAEFRFQANVDGNAIVAVGTEITPTNEVILESYTSGQRLNMGFDEAWGLFLIGERGSAVLAELDGSIVLFNQGMPMTEGALRDLLFATYWQKR